MTEMRPDLPRKNAFARPDTPSLKEIRDRIASDYGIETQRRRDLTSAIETFGEWSGRPLDLIPAEMGYIRKVCGRLHPTELGVSIRRIQNVRSLIKAAFRLLGVSTKLPARTTALSSKYQALWDMLDGDKYAKRSLSSFLRYCSASGISPGAINDAVSQSYLSALETESLIKDPRIHHQVACKVWNAKSNQHRDKGWPVVELTVPRYDTRLYAIGDDRVSSGIKADIEAYTAHLTGKDLFNSVTVPLRPSSILATKGHIWRYLSALHHSGVDLRNLKSLDEAVTQEMFKRAMQWHYDRNGQATSKHISEIAWTIRCYVVKYRNADQATSAFFSQAVSKLRVTHEGLSPKNRKAMGQFDDPARVARFVRAPLNLWAKAEALRDKSEDGPIPQQALLMVQAGIASEIMIFAPIRLHNLATIRLDQHINRINGRIHLHFEAGEVKNNLALDFVLPESTSKRIDRYIKDWRPAAKPDGNPYLFPGRNQKPKDESALRNLITDKLFLVTGIKLTPHQFRHTAAKLFLDKYPGQYEVVRKVLGHKALSTTYSHYAGAETKAAIAHYDDAIVSLLNGSQNGAVPQQAQPQQTRPFKHSRQASRFTGMPFVEPPLLPPQKTRRSS